MKKFVVELLKDESGLTTVEYAVGAALVVVMAGVFFTGVGTAIGGTATKIAAAITG